MNEEEKQAIEYIRNCLDDEYDFKNATRQKDKDVYKIILELIEKQQKEIEELRQRINRLIVMKYVENDYYTEVRKENSVSKYKIRKLIKEKAKTDTYNFKTIAVKDIEELLGE